MTNHMIWRQYQDTILNEVSFHFLKLIVHLIAYHHTPRPEIPSATLNKT